MAKARADSVTSMELEQGRDQEQDELLYKDKPIHVTSMQLGSRDVLHMLFGCILVTALVLACILLFGGHTGSSMQPSGHADGVDKKQPAVFAAWPSTHGLTAGPGVTLWPPQAASAAAASASHYHYYYVQNSTVPGAGVGLYARRDMPAGTIWNKEDSRPDGTIILNGKQWKSLLALAEHLKAAGYHKHPIVHVVKFMDVYGYPCDQDSYVVSLTPSTFVNHAPEAPKAPHLPQPTKHTGAAASSSSQSSSQGSATHQRPHKAYANSGGLPANTSWVQKLSTVEQCTLSITLRAIKAGEELLEDYRRYCDEGEKCDEPGFIRDSHDYTQDEDETDDDNDDDDDDRRRFRRSLMAASRLGSAFPRKSGTAEEEDADDEKHVLVELQGVRVGRSSSPAAVRDLGLYATKDMPAGTVWNKEDAQHSLVISRGQWDMIIRMQKTLAAIHVVKPVISHFVEALRILGYCCPRTEHMYIPLTTSLFANPAAPKTNAAHSPAGSSSHHSSHGDRSKAAHTGSSSGCNSGLAGGKGLNDTAACTWSNILKPVKKGDAILDNRRLQVCTWPGLQAPRRPRHFS